MKINNETKIGFMVFVVLVLLAILTVKSSDFSVSQEGYTIKILFNDINGVDLNAPVMINGFEKGVVKDIKIVEVKQEVLMELTVFLQQDVRIKEGAKAHVKNMGFMGEKYVGLTSGKKGGKDLKAGSIVMGEPPADLDQLLSDGQEIASQIKEISTNINDRLKKNEQKIDNIIANFDTSLTNIKSISSNIDQRLKVNESNVDDIILNLRAASVNLDEFTYDLKINPWKLMYRPKKRKLKSQ